MGITGRLALLGVMTLAADTVQSSYDEAGRFVRVAYGNGKTITDTYDRTGNLLRRQVTAAQPGPTPTATAAEVVNAASFAGGPVAPGEIVTISETGIGPATLIGLRLAPGGFSGHLCR